MPAQAKAKRFHSWFTGVSAVIGGMFKPRRLFPGGSQGNEHLTAVVAAVLLLLLFVEGATLLNMRSLLTVHVLVGLLLIPIVALKLGSTGWRMLRYYLGSEDTSNADLRMSSCAPWSHR